MNAHPDSGHRLETLPFENGFARLLPTLHYTRLQPWSLPEPYLVAGSDEAAALIGLDPAEFERADFAEHFAGNRLPPGAEPLAAVYSGHQFGQWAGQLGDGRAHLLGEVAGPAGGWEIQLKGAGRTPYSRMGDGRAVLRSSIREFLCSEAMAGLGIPTTRALCVVGSDQPVRREEVESAAVVTRLAPSFIRFGSFEHWAAAGKIDELHQLADFVIARYRPELMAAINPYEALVRDVACRTGELLARWQAVGFMHGVMNTDNMSILGLTLDYGPFGFMEAFDAGHVCNHSDHQGRYAYRRQPQVAHWNLYALGNALLPLIGEPEAAQAAIDEPYVAAYNGDFLRLMAAKLGFAGVAAEDEDFVASLYTLLHRNRVDYPLFFRQLGKLPAVVAETDRPAADAPLRDQFLDREACDAWLATWRARLAVEGRPDAERRAAMNAVNPKYVLRNWIAEQAIRRAREGDFAEVRAVLRCLRRPCDEQPEFEPYAAPPPDWASGLAVSCSS
jgi:protein adenylyltransferase